MQERTTGKANAGFFADLGERWRVEIVEWENGIRVFGALWAVPAAGFILIAVSLLAEWEWWRPVLVAVTLFWLVLAVVDWSIAYAGVVIDTVILAVVWLGPRIGSWLSR